MARETLSSSDASSATDLTDSGNDSIPPDPELLQLRRDAALANQRLIEAQAALEAQKGALTAQRAAERDALDSMRPIIPQNSPLSGPGDSNQYPKTNRPDPIEGSWIVVSMRGCEQDIGTLDEFRSNGWSGAFRIIRRSTDTNTFVLQSGGNGIVTKVSGGLYVMGSGQNRATWQLTGLTLQMTATYQYTGPLTGYRSCTMVGTAQKQ
jgi:hypothetical protein